MSTDLFCQKLQKWLPSLDEPPFPTPLGEKIYKNISKQAWDLWMNQQTMLINEYRLNLLDKSAKKFLFESMEKFLFENKNL